MLWSLYHLLGPPLTIQACTKHCSKPHESYGCQSKPAFHTEGTWHTDGPASCQGKLHCPPSLPQKSVFPQNVNSFRKKQKPRNDSNGTIRSLGQMLMGSRKLMHIKLVRNCTSEYYKLQLCSLQLKFINQKTGKMRVVANLKPAKSMSNNLSIRIPLRDQH